MTRPTRRHPHRRSHSRRTVAAAALAALALAGGVVGTDLVGADLAGSRSPSPAAGALVAPDGDAATAASTRTPGSAGGPATTRPVVAEAVGGPGVSCPAGFTTSPAAGCVRAAGDGLAEVAQPDGEVVTVVRPHAHGTAGHRGSDASAAAGRFAATRSWAMDDVGRRPVACAPTGSPRVVAVHAHRAGQASANSTVRAAVRSVVERSNALVAGSARASGGPAADLRFACTRGGAVQVTSLVVPGPDYAQIRQAAVDAGLDRPHEKYLVFVELASPDPAISGMAQRYGDDRRVLDNRNNGVAPMHGVVWDGHWDGVVPLHELTHMMGGIQPGAPGSDGAGHCTDGRDLLCTSFERTHCDDYAYDCGHDSYFSTAPAPGSYLATHWNLGWTGNRFVDVVGEAPEAPEPEPTPTPEPTPSRSDEGTADDEDATGAVETTGALAGAAGDVAGAAAGAVVDTVPVETAGEAAGDLVGATVGVLGGADSERGRTD